MKKQTDLQKAFYAWYGARFNLRQKEANLSNLFSFGAHSDALIEQAAIEHRDAEDQFHEATTRIRILLNG